jgi:inorganic triphosphatase YgiF
LATLKPVFQTSVRRTTLTVQRDDALIELAFDRGHVAADGRRRPICEMEAELKQGGRLEPLYSIALELQKRADLHVGSPSKAELGYLLLNGAEEHAAKSTPIALPKKVSVADGFRQIVRACVAELLANQAAAVAGTPAGVHQLRVAVRRIRAALRLFGDYIERTGREELERELRWVGREVGAARDWDVFIENLFTSYIRDDMTVDTVSQRTGLAHQRAAAAIQSPRYTRLLLRLQRWSEGNSWYAHPGAKGRAELDSPLAQAAPRMLTRMADAVEKRAKHLQRLSGVERHSLRKQAKKLRYSIEFLSAFYAARENEYHRRLKKLLRTLGRINDLSAARNLLESTGAERWAADALQSDYADSLTALPKSWKRFARVPRFWEHV